MDCGGLTNLIPSSTVACLENLRSLVIIGCAMIEEIVAADHHDSQQDDHIIIIFPNLWNLVLVELPRLTSFCTANNYTFKFPQLIYVEVRECPNMKNFSPGITITPRLKEVSFRDGERHWINGDGDLNTTIQQHFFSQMEPQRLTTTDPTTSSNNHVEPEAHIHEKPTESLGKEAEKICEGLTEPIKDGVGGLGKKAEISENVVKPENEIEVCEHVVDPREGIAVFEKGNGPRNGSDICEEVVEEGKVTDSCEKGKGKEVEICEEKVVDSVGNENETSNHPLLESNISIKSHPYYFQGNAGSSSRIMPLNQHGESSFPPLSDPSSHNPANEPEEQTNAASLAPQDAFASSSQLSPTSDHLETSSSLVTSASNSQQKDFEGLRVTKHFIPLLSKVLQILQTQPLNSMSAEQVQFMEDASRDLSSMNFPMEWLSPYLEKARKCLSVVDRTKAISELELKIVEIEAQLQALEENKKALNETKKALEEENEAIASGMDLNKPLYDD